MIAAVVIEPWKLPIFSKHLREGGYWYDTAPGIAAGTITLKVGYTSLEGLKVALAAAQEECKAAKP